MKKRLSVILYLLLFIAPGIFAQDGDLEVQGTTPSLYLTHTVAPKENWYSVGRLYNISPKELAPYNQSSLTSPLSIGQLIKVPLIASNFSQDSRKQAGEVLVPVYHTVQEKEWMYRVSVNYNKVPMDRLEKWNGITRDQVKQGMRLIVGYLKVNPAQSALASRAGKAPVTTQEPMKTASEPVASTSNPPTNQPTTTKQVTQPVATTEPVKEKVVQPEEPKRVSSVKQDMREGFFKSIYQPTGKSLSGNGNIFKSNSGWDDAKYYALINNMPVGTIIKVTNSATSKSVYAKVLGSLPEMKESAGLVLRISDAAAAELGAPDGKFAAVVGY